MKDKSKYITTQELWGKLFTARSSEDYLRNSSYGHRLFAGGRNPSRDTVLQLAFGFELDPEGAQELLKIARAAQLHPKVKRDAVIAFCLHRGQSLIEAQQALMDHGLPILGGARNGL